MELLVVMAIASILMALAIPQFQSQAVSSARARGGRDLVGALNLARSEAIARNSGVSVCRRNYFTSNSTPTCAISSGQWAQGWIVYRDTNGTVDATEPASAADIIAVYEPAGTVTADGNGDALRILPAPSAAVVQFNSTGRPIQTQSLQFTLCDKTGHLKDGRAVQIGLSGYVSLRALTTSETLGACPG